MTTIVDRFNQGVSFDELYQPDVALRFCVLLALKYAVGHENRKLGETLFFDVRSIWHFKVDGSMKPPGDRKIRNCIRQLRKEGALIVSTGGTKGGYWVSTSFKEDKHFVQTELIARALDELHTAKRILESSRRKYGQQAEIWRDASMSLIGLKSAITQVEDL